MSVFTQNDPKPKILVIGWDSADAELVEQWCGEGLLPNITRMRSEGTSARMQTTASTTHVSAWPSIFTGTTPDKHGLYHAYITPPGTQGPIRPQPDKTPFPFLWKLLSDRGKRCIVMDAFLTCPLQDFNGSQIVDWGSWSHFWGTTITPAALKTELEKRFGRYPAEDHSKVGMSPLYDFHGLHTRLLSAITKKTQVVKWLMHRENWDFFMVVFGESHPAGHYFWQFHDPSYLAHSESEAGALRHALREVYVALDRAIGELLQSIDDKTTVFLVSGDGMGPNYSGSHLLNDLLARMRLFNSEKAADGKFANDTPKESSRPGTDFLGAIRNMVPERLRIAVTRTLLPRSVQEKLSLRWKTAGISWDRTRAFLIENANEGYIRINLKGREPQGIVELGKEYEDLCEEIYQTANSAINPVTGALAASTVYKTDDIYNGPCRSHLPDIIINWSEDARITTELLTSKYGVVRSAKPACAHPPYYTGNHRPNAFLICNGPDVARGAVSKTANILDLAPTILDRFGIEPPGHFDGRVLTELRASYVTS